MTFWPANVICNWAVQYNNRMKKKTQRSSCWIGSKSPQNSVSSDLSRRCVLYYVRHVNPIQRQQRYVYTLQSERYLFILFTQWFCIHDLCYNTTNRARYSEPWIAHFAVSSVPAKTCLWQVVRPRVFFFVGLFLLQCNCYCVPENLSE